MSHLGTLKCEERNHRLCSTPALLSWVPCACRYRWLWVNRASRCSCESRLCRGAALPSRAMPCPAVPVLALQAGRGGALSAMLAARHVELPQRGGGAGCGEVVRWTTDSLFSMLLFVLVVATALTRSPRSRVFQVHPRGPNPMLLSGKLVKCCKNGGCQDTVILSSTLDFKWILSTWSLLSQCLCRTHSALAVWETSSAWCAWKQQPDVAPQFGCRWLQIYQSC